MNKKDTKQQTTTRRKFLKKAGKLAVYTPPVMLAAANPSFAEIAKSGGEVPTICEEQQIKCDILPD